MTETKEQNPWEDRGPSRTPGLLAGNPSSFGRYWRFTSDLLPAAGKDIAPHRGGHLSSIEPLITLLHRAERQWGVTTGLKVGDWSLTSGCPVSLLISERGRHET